MRTWNNLKKKNASAKEQDNILHAFGETGRPDWTVTKELLTVIEIRDIY